MDFKNRLIEGLQSGDIKPRYVTKYLLDNHLEEIDQIYQLTQNMVDTVKTLNKLFEKDNIVIGLEAFKKGFYRLHDKEDRKILRDSGRVARKTNPSTIKPVGSPSIAKPIDTSSNLKNPSISKPELASSQQAKIKGNELENPSIVTMQEAIEARKEELRNQGMPSHEILGLVRKEIQQGLYKKYPDTKELEKELKKENLTESEETFLRLLEQYKGDVESVRNSFKNSSTLNYLVTQRVLNRPTDFDKMVDKFAVKINETKDNYSKQ